MSERHRYVVLGAGRQGTAAAYDLALRGGAIEIVLADAEVTRAEAAKNWLLDRLPLVVDFPPRRPERSGPRSSRRPAIPEPPPDRRALGKGPHGAAGDRSAADGSATDPDRATYLDRAPRPAMAGDRSASSGSATDPDRATYLDRAPRPAMASDRSASNGPATDPDSTTHLDRTPRPAIAGDRSDAGGPAPRAISTANLEAIPRLATAVVDASDGAALTELLSGASAAIGALPYRFDLGVTRAAIEAGCSLCDLGGHTDTTQEQLLLDEAARRAGIAVVPDCGQAPGMATTLMVLALGMVDEPEALEVWDGGLPLDPQPPLGYRLLFSVEGLTNEYDGPCWNIRGGEVAALEPLSEEQTVEFPPPLGTLEAFCASGTASTFPWTYSGRLHEFTSRILRYPGHLAAIRTLRSLGFFSTEAVALQGRRVVPRRLTERLLESALGGEGRIRDIVAVRVHCRGRESGRPARAEVESIVLHDEATGLGAMQRSTGFDAAIVAAMLARGEIAPGVRRRELSIEPERYVAELARREILVTRRLVR